MPTIADRSAEVHLGTESAPRQLQGEEQPMRLLLLGDFSGRAWREKNPPSGNPVRIDRDNFDDVLAGLEIELDLDGTRLSLRELEDFHPDRICSRLGLPHAAEAAAAPARPPLDAGRPLLDQILAGEPDARPARAEDANDLADFIRRAMAGQTAPRQTAAAREGEAGRDARSQQALRGILRHPRFQAIESVWRAAWLLARGLDTAGLEIYLLDIALAELVARCDAVAQALAQKGDWGCLAANYTFGQSDTEARVLARLADMAQAAGAPFLAEGRIEEPGELWPSLRQSEQAHWIGLAMPRFLLRLPYGKDTAAIESFPFEEMDASEHGAYLWGNPAFFCAYLVGQSFGMHGWNFGRRLARRLDGLPQHIYREDGEAVAKPCAELLMTEREAEGLLDAGFMPVASIKNEPAALIVRFQSIASPAAPLAFR